MSVYKFVGLFSNILLALALVACSGGGGSGSANTDASLSALLLSAGSISPAFQTDVTAYTLAVDNSVDTTTVTPSQTDTNATVTVNGIAVSSGAASAAIALAVGDNTISTVVTAADGTSQQTYTVVVTRTAPSSVATLSGLGLSAGSLSPSFQADVTAYTLAVATTVDSTTVTPTLTDSNAAVTVNGIAVASGAASGAIALVVGDNTISTVVTAEDGSSQQTYTVVVTRAAPGTVATLSGLSLSAGSITPAFLATTTSYSLTVATAVITTAVTATATDANASITVDGDVSSSGVASTAIALAAGANTITVEVTAEDGVSSQTYTVNVQRAPASFELVDPAAAAGNKFGKELTILANGNIVIPVPDDSSLDPAYNNGAVHLFNPYTQSIIKSFYGDDVDDSFGFNSSGTAITALSNGNFVIASSSDRVAGIINAGSVTLVNGTTGAVIGTPISGDLPSDQLGSSGVQVLANGNYVISSPNDGANTEGSVILVDGATGDLIGTPIEGDATNDKVGLSGVLVLPNGNFVIASPFVDGAQPDTGSVMLVDGITGVQIGATIVGSTAGDQLGSGMAKALSNGNFVIASPFVDGAQPDTGSVMLVNGSTGGLIKTVDGDDDEDKFGSSGITVLTNDNFIIASADDDGAVIDGGSVILVDGTTGIEIDRISGDTNNDRFGANPGVTALSNGHYVIAAPQDVIGGNNNAGSVRLMNGTTGEQIGTAIEGDSAGDAIGLNGITELSNGNYVIASSGDDLAPNINVGSVKLIDGSNGALISQVTGDVNGDNIGENGVTALANGNYVIVSQSDDDPSGFGGEGSVMLMEGAAGTQVGSTIYGDLQNDFLGKDAGGAIALSNNNVVIISEEDNEPSIADAGSMILMDGTSGAQIDKITGGVADDFDVVPTVDDVITESPFGDYFILAISNADNTEGVDSGRVLLFTQ